MAATAAGARSFVVSLVGRIIVVGAADEESADAFAEQHLDSVMDEMMRLQAQDATIELDLCQSEVMFSVLVRASDPIEATNIASGQIRAAIHAAGGATPDWPEPYDEAWAVQLLRLSSEVVTADDTAEDEECEELVPAQ